MIISNRIGVSAGHLHNHSRNYFSVDRSAKLVACFFTVNHISMISAYFVFAGVLGLHRLQQDGIRPEIQCLPLHYKTGRSRTAGA